MAAPNRRKKIRSEIDPVSVTSFISLDHMTQIARVGRIVQASATGLLLQIDHKELIPQILRENLTLDALKGDKVIFKIAKFELELAGVVTRTRLVGRKIHEIAIDYSEEAPEYWREILCEMLPRLEESDAEFDA